MVTKFSVFPNPASTTVNIQLTLTDNTDVRIELFDLTGKQVLAENAGMVKQLNYTLNTSSVPNGIYVLHLTGSKLNIEQRISVSK